MDINVQAYRLVREATGELSPEKKRKRAGASRGGIAGGKKRAAVLTPERRREIAKKANLARWQKAPLASVSE